MTPGTLLGRPGLFPAASWNAPEPRADLRPPNPKESALPRLILERHAHAPEMNRAHVLAPDGRAVAVLAVPGCQSIREARARLFPQPAPGIVARVAYVRPAPWAGLNRAYGGRVASRAAGLAYVRAALDARHKGGPLSDGSALPDAARRLSFALCN